MQVIVVVGLLQYYKGVTFELERFMRKATVEFKVPGLYLINAVCSVSKKKFQDKVRSQSRFVPVARLDH